jgi:hypothetical protein
VKWDPHRENNDLLFNQSASLWATYYLIQILVHRPFIPSRKKTPSSTIPSLAICTNAARACCHVVDVQQRRTGAVIPQVQVRRIFKVPTHGNVHFDDFFTCRWRCFRALSSCYSASGAGSALACLLMRAARCRTCISA